MEIQNTNVKDYISNHEDEFLQAVLKLLFILYGHQIRY